MAIRQSEAQGYELRDPDVRLMLQVRDDDAAAFEELVLRYQSRLLTVLENLCGKRDLAEDLAQDVFLRVYRARKRYEPTSKFSTWLYKIAGNVASNARRGMARRREVNMESRESGPWGAHPMEQMALAASGQMPTRQLDKSEVRDVVQQAVAALNDRQRLAVLLAKFEEMNYADIGEVMNLTPQAVKSLLSRARATLRESLDSYLKSGERNASGVTL